MELSSSAALSIVTVIASISAVVVSFIAMVKSERLTKIQVKTAPLNDLLDALEEYREITVGLSAYFRFKKMSPNDTFQDVLNEPANLALHKVRARARRWAVTFGHVKAWNATGELIRELSKSQEELDDIARFGKPKGSGDERGLVLSDTFDRVTDELTDLLIVATNDNYSARKVAKRMKELQAICETLYARKSLPSSPAHKAALQQD